MIGNKEYALMIDLAKLLRKHGPEAFESLAALLSSREFMEKLSAVLTNTATIGQTGYSTRVPPLTKELSRMKDVEPKKYEIMRSFIAEFESGRILPTLKDVNRFVAENNLPGIKAQSRSRAIAPLTRRLLPLPSDDIEKMLSRLVRQGRSDSSLSQWSEIITKGMSRSIPSDSVKEGESHHKNQ